VEEEERKEEDKRRRKERERREAEKREEEEKRELEIQRRKEAELAAKQRDSDKEGEIVRIRTYLADLKHTRAIEAEHKAVMETEAAAAAAADKIRQEEEAAQAKITAEQEKIRNVKQKAAEKLAVEEFAASMRVIESKMMEEEDGMSQLYAQQLAEAEKQRLAKISFLEDLYTPFKSMFEEEDDDTPMLASSRNITSRMEITASKRHPKDSYSIPHAQAILEVPECEVYSYSMSSSFQKNLGMSNTALKRKTAGRDSVEESLHTLARSRSVGMLQQHDRSRPSSRSASKAYSRPVSTSGETHKLPHTRRYNQRSVGTAPLAPPRKNTGRTKRSASRAVFEQSRPGIHFREKIGVTGAVAPLHPSLMHEAALEALGEGEPEV
jgi:hypothetical protein